MSHEKSCKTSSFFLQNDESTMSNGEGVCDYFVDKCIGSEAEEPHLQKFHDDNFGFDFTLFERIDNMNSLDDSEYGYQ